MSCCSQRKFSLEKKQDVNVPFMLCIWNKPCSGTENEKINQTGCSKMPTGKIKQTNAEKCCPHFKKMLKCNKKICP